MAYTFEQLYKQKLKGDLLTAISSTYDVIVSNDIGLYVNGKVAFKGNEILGVVTSGSGIRMQQEVVVINQSLMVTLYVPLNYTQQFNAILTDYLMDQSSIDLFHVFYVDSNGVYYSAPGTGRSLAYTARFTYQTPIVDGTKININGYDYQQITITADAMYMEIPLPVGENVFKLYYSTNGSTYTQIPAISEWALSTAMVGDSTAKSGNKLTTSLPNANTASLVFVMIDDGIDAVLKQLKRYAWVMPPLLYFKVVDGLSGFQYTFTGHLRLNTNGGSNRFLTITGSITIQDSITETVVS